MLEPTSPHSPTTEPGPLLHVRWLGRMGYEEALLLQESLLAAKMAGDTRDYLLLLEHEPVYTLGRGADENDLQGAPARLGVPVFRVGRGGGATYHGPGQLVAYPLLRLDHHGRDVHRYVRGLEACVIATCRELGIDASVRPGSTGVWAGNGKIASIGIGVRRGVTCHGVAINVATNLGHFEAIVPCREPGLRLTSIERLHGAAPPLEQVAGVFARCFARTFGYHFES
jgi:lipoate-protein ligase B